MAFNAVRQRRGRTLLEVMDGAARGTDRPGSTAICLPTAACTSSWPTTPPTTSTAPSIWCSRAWCWEAPWQILDSAALSAQSHLEPFVVAAAIPISVIGTFILMCRILGRTLNVISLAGMAFAVGMVVDNSIVVLENTYRHQPDGQEPFPGRLSTAPPRSGGRSWPAP